MNIDNAAKRIKHHLENTYDIPFDVEAGINFRDPWFKIKPHNEGNELFTIHARFRNQIRLIIEVAPEKYAAFSIKDMALASIEKKKLFSEYARQLENRRAKMEFFINDVPRNITNPESWPDEWQSYRLRISRSPVCSEDEVLDEAEVTSSWVVIVTGMLLSLLNIVVEEDSLHYEGGVHRTEVNRYERNPINRELCLAVHGYTCKICSFNFEQSFGELGRHFIHVHHIVPVSEMETAYLLDPTTDLIPVCPNCHAMLHRSTPPLLPNELIELISKAHCEAK